MQTGLRPSAGGHLPTCGCRPIVKDFRPIVQDFFRARGLFRAPGCLPFGLTGGHRRASKTGFWNPCRGNTQDADPPARARSRTPPALDTRIKSLLPSRSGHCARAARYASLVASPRLVATAPMESRNLTAFRECSIALKHDYGLPSEQPRRKLVQIPHAVTATTNVSSAR